MDPTPVPHIGLREAFGLQPLRPALAGCWRALAGSGEMPGSRFDHTSMRIFKPRIALPTWLGHRRADGRVVVYNLFNRRLPPQGAVHSVRVTDCEDFRGGRLTYDGHVGTDFAIPVGTPVTTVAPARVLRVRNDMERGGLKVVLDHGGGLVTCSCHLARAQVREGQVVGRGEVVALSGASGVDVLLCFPWVAPHLHLGVYHDGAPVDPYARAGEVSLWRRANDPVPYEGSDGATHRRKPAPGADERSSFVDSRWDVRAVDASIEACRSPRERARLGAIEDDTQRAIEVFLARAFTAPLFTAFPSLFLEVQARRPLFDLPFLARDYRSAVLPDETGAVG